LLAVPALPTVAQVVVFYGGLLVVAMLVSGVVEGPAVCVLTHARRLNNAEQTLLAPITAELCRHGLGPPVSEVYVARSSVNVPARACGRRHAVLAPWIIQAVRSGHLPHDEALAVVAHASLVAQSGMSRQSLTVAFWTLPWRTLCTIARPLRGLLPEFVWKARCVVFSVAIWQSAMTGPPIVGPISAAVLTVILAMTYLSPICARHQERHVTQTADDSLVDLGLGLAMANFLRRHPRTTELEARLDVLEATARPSSRLRLVQ